jgi:ABC-2 type transport system permease protein
MSSPTTDPAPIRPGEQRRPSTVQLLAHEIRFGLKVFTRTPFSASVSLVLPLFFLLLFNLANRGENVPGTDTPFVQYSVPAIIVFVVVSAGYLTMAISVTVAREKGILRRLRTKPVPPWVHFVGRILVVGIVILVSLAVMIAVAMPFGFRVTASAVPGAALALVVGTLTFCMLGLAITTVIPTPEAAPAVSMVVVFPLLFASGVFFPIPMPGWLEGIIYALPVRPFGLALRESFAPSATGVVIAWPELGIMLAWSLLGLFVALRFFRWEPRPA